jgi:hypothetical protein
MRRVALVWLMFVFFLGILFYVLVYQNPLISDSVLKIAASKGFTTDNAVINNIPLFINNGLIWDVLDFKKLAALLVALTGSIVCLVSGVHLLIDKLFFRKFFEQPALIPALRRGILVAIVVIMPIFFRLINGLVWYNVASIVVLCICIEILIVNVFNDFGRKQPKNN